MTKFKNLEELEKAYFELKKEFTKKCQERAELEKVVKLQKTVNDALIEENLDYSYDITDLAYERAKEMAKCWERGYQEEIKDLKKALELACEEITELESPLNRFCWQPKDEVVEHFKTKAKEMMKSE